MFRFAHMADRERLRDRLTNKFNHLLHSLVPRRSRSSSPNHPIGRTLDPQVSATPAQLAPDRPDPSVDDEIPNTPSLSNIYPSIVIDPTGDETPGRMADLASAVFQGAKTTLLLVERTAGGLPPLKSAVSGLLGVIDIVEVRYFQLSVVIVIVMTVPRQPLRTNEIAKIWNGS